MPRPVACSFCRQNKLRCNASQNQDGPCQQCKMRRKDCVIDRDFKRKSARRRSRHSIDNDNDINRTRTAIDQDYNLSSSTDIHIQDAASVLKTRIGLNERAESADRARLGDLTISRSQAELLFRVYLEHYHQILPVLDPQLDVWKLRAQCPLLFWTIIATASRHSSQDRTTFENLPKLLPNLVTEQSFHRTYSLAPCQALLILCIWPFPISKQREDVRWMYSGIAMQMATLAGLHKLEFAHEYDRAETTRGSYQDRNLFCRTWFCCCYVNSLISCELGLPPSNLIENVDLTNVNENCISMAFQSKLRVVLENAKTNLTIHNTWPSGTLTPPLISFLGMAQKPLAALEAQHRQPERQKDLLNQYLTLAAIINVQSISLNHDLSSAPLTSLLNAQNAVLIAAIGIGRCFRQLVPTYLSPLQDSLDIHDQSTLCPACVPKFIWRHAWAAAIVLIKLLIDGVVPTDKVEEARSTVDSIQQSLASCSTYVGDELATGARLIGLLSKADIQKSFRMDQARHPSSLIRTRLGVSVTYDLVYRSILWRKKFNTNVSAFEPNGNHQNSTNADHQELGFNSLATNETSTASAIPTTVNDNINNEQLMNVLSDTSFDFLTSFDDINSFWSFADELSPSTFVSDPNFLADP